MRIKAITILAALWAGIAGMSAEQCEIPLAVADITQGDQVPAGVNSQLQSHLMRIAAKSGVVGDPNSRFFIAGRFDKAFFDVAPGPSQTYYINTTLTLYIGDSEDQKIFATTTIDMKGTGISEEKAYITALKSLKAKNPAFQEFMDEGKQKIVDYYTTNAPKILQKARTALQNRDYDEAIYQAASIPECSPAFGEAGSLLVSAYKDRTNYEDAQLLAEAQAEWGAHPDASGAEKAYAIISRMDPKSSSYSAAMALSDKMAKQVNAQWTFEHVQKYKDALALEKQRMANEHAERTALISAAKSVAIARAKSRPRVVHHYHWF